MFSRFKTPIVVMIVFSVIQLQLFFCFTSNASKNNNGVSRYFDRTKEFPNYFLPINWRQSAPETVPADVIAQKRRLVEQALASLFERIMMPIEENGSIHLVRIFPYLANAAKALDPKANIMPQGGVIRAALSYIYRQLYDGENAIPLTTAEETLARIIDDKTEIRYSKILGVGSDVDIGVTSSVSEKIAEVLKRILNSADKRIGGIAVNSNVGLGARRAVLPMADIKDYNQQLSKATNQGGVTLDHLAYDLSTGKILEPETNKDIITKFLKGEVQYVGPSSLNTTNDRVSTVFRALRPLHEFPFIAYTDDRILRKELTNLIASVKSGEMPDERATRQLTRSARNAFPGGASNRLYRGEPNSIEEMFLNLSNLVAVKKTDFIPEYVDRFSLAKRTDQKAELNGLPKRLLMDKEEFITQHTDKGVIFHGTPNLEAGIGILRDNLYTSTDEHGKAEFGRGGYAAQEKSYASARTTNGGLVFELKISASPYLNILDWNQVKDDPFIRGAKKIADEQGRDLFEYLAREHGIDIIVNHFVLLQNVAAVQLPSEEVILEKTASELAESIKRINGSAVDQSLGTAINKLREICRYHELQEYRVSLGYLATKDPEIETRETAIVPVIANKLRTVNLAEKEGMEALSFLSDSGRYDLQSLVGVERMKLLMSEFIKRDFYNSVGATHVYDSYGLTQALKVAHKNLPSDEWLNYFMSVIGSHAKIEHISLEATELLTSLLDGILKSHPEKSSELMEQCLAGMYRTHHIWPPAASEPLWRYIFAYLKTSPAVSTKSREIISILAQDNFNSALTTNNRARLHESVEKLKISMEYARIHEIYEDNLYMLIREYNGHASNLRDHLYLISPSDKVKINAKMKELEILASWIVDEAAKTPGMTEKNLTKYKKLSFPFPVPNAPEHWSSSKLNCVENLLHHH